MEAKQLLQNNPCLFQKSLMFQKKETRKYFKLIENEYATYQNLLFRGKFIALSAYVRKEEMFQITNLSFH